MNDSEPTISPVTQEDIIDTPKPEDRFPYRSDDPTQIIILGNPYKIDTVRDSLKHKYPLHTSPADSYKLSLVIADTDQNTNFSLTPQQLEHLAHKVCAPFYSPESYQIASVAQKNNIWFKKTDIPPPEPGLVRIFRGIIPNAISTEFNPPFTQTESELFESAIKKAQNNQPLSPQEAQLRTPDQTRRWMADRNRFYTDDVEAAIRYALDGIIYYLDLPVDTLRDLQNIGSSDIAFEIPWDMAQHQEMYAIGPKALQYT